MSLPDLIITPLHSFNRAGGVAANAAELSAKTGGKNPVDNYFMTEFQESISPRYNLTNTFGRMDPIVNYQGTGRKIVLGVKCTQATNATNFHNSMKKIMYPVFDATSEIPNALLIERPPLVMVHYGNLIQDPETKGALLCVLEQYSATPAAGFTPLDSPLVRFGATTRTKDADGNISISSQQIIDFQQYSFRFDFIPLHSKTPGFNNSATPAWIGGPNF